MDAREFKVTEILSRNERFIVPLYQRQYQWHDHKNYGGRTSAFWLDVVAKATEVLEDEARFDHYMGALLLAPEVGRRSFGTTPSVQVVDGQQRLTTFLILIAALREVARSHEYELLVEQVNGYIFNDLGRGDTDVLAKYKLTPTPVDQKVFLDLLDRPYEEVRARYDDLYWGGKITQKTSHRSLRAYEYFKAQVEEFVASGESDDTEIDIDEEQTKSWEAETGEESKLYRRMDALLEALVFRLKLIVITLDAEDDAQVIFETLNSRGQPLLAMDLVRNNIFHRAEAENRGAQDARKRTKELYTKIWKPFDDGWWRDSAPNARPARPRIDHFLANLLTAETGKRVTVRELYAEYRAWATPNRRPRFEKVKDELAVLQKYAPTYETLEGRKDGDNAISWLGGRLRLWQNTTAYPIAFQIASSDLDEESRWTIAKWINSYLARRTLCNLTAKNLNRLFPKLAGYLYHYGITISNVRDFWQKNHRDSTRFPNDDELRSGILENCAYGRIPSRVLCDLLWSIELASRTRMTEATERPPKLWVEHVMPQNWHENWPLNGELVDPQPFAGLFGSDVSGYSERQTAIQTLGNLTITTDRLNQSMGQAPFSEKALKLVEHSNLTLNKRIVEYDAWDETSIRERGENLAKLAVALWPSPFQA